MFSWPFLLAAVQFPILGVDFVHHYVLLVDPAGEQLVDCFTLQAFYGSPPEPGDCLYLALSLKRASVPLFLDGQAIAYSSVPASLGVHKPLLRSSGLYSSHRLSISTPASSATCGRKAWASGVQVSWDAFGGRCPSRSLVG